MPESVKVKSLMLFASGQFAAINEHGEQMTRLQTRSAIELFAEWAAQNGFDPSGCEVRTQLPCGDGPQCTIEGSVGDYFECPTEA